ncbi:HipA domain-containing protein [Schaalia hyovaginalis]
MRFAGTAAIVTTRYDRFTVSDAHFYRLHQEDLRQSTSTLPHCKYEVTARDVVSVLRKTGAAGEQIDLFTQGVLLSWILAAPDAPAKNYSVVLAGNKPVLVPLYDVATGLGQAIKYDRLAMAIGGENRMSAVKSEHVLRFAEAPALDGDALQDFAALSAPLTPPSPAPQLSMSSSHPTSTRRNSRKSASSPTCCAPTARVSCAAWRECSSARSSHAVTSAMSSS